MTEAHYCTTPMEIYLLREEKEVGPYTGEDIRTWFHEGQVAADEFAWSPGLESWQPLHTVVELPVAEPAYEAVAEVEPVVEVRPQPVKPLKPARPVHQATARQKAFLSYMGIYFTPVLSEEDAEEQIQRFAQEDRVRRGIGERSEEEFELGSAASRTPAWPEIVGTAVLGIAFLVALFG